MFQVPIVYSIPSFLIMLAPTHTQIAVQNLFTIPILQLQMKKKINMSLPVLEYVQIGNVHIHFNPRLTMI